MLLVSAFAVAFRSNNNDNNSYNNTNDVSGFGPKVGRSGHCFYFRTSRGVIGWHVACKAGRGRVRTGVFSNNGSSISRPSRGHAFLRACESTHAKVKEAQMQ